MCAIYRLHDYTLWPFVLLDNYSMLPYWLIVPLCFVYFTCAYVYLLYTDACFNVKNVYIITTVIRSHITCKAL